LALCKWLKSLLPAAASVLAACASSCAPEPEPPLAAVSGFEVQRYLGEWHQVAAIPAWFQEDCAANTTARYALAEDGLIAVLNSCETADGSLKEAEARARFLGATSEGRLEVTFVDLLGFWVWWAAGDYWIIGLDPDYRWAAIGQPSRSYAWILARTPSLDDATLTDIARILERAGYDPCRLKMSAPGRQGRLCDMIRQSKANRESRAGNPQAVR